MQEGGEQVCCYPAWSQEVGEGEACYCYAWGLLDLPAGLSLSVRKLWGSHTIIKHPHTMIKSLHRQLPPSILHHLLHQRRLRERDIIHAQLGRLFWVHPAGEQGGGGAGEGAEAVGFDVFFASHFGAGGVVVGEGVGDDGAGLGLWHCENSGGGVGWGGGLYMV